MLQRRMGWADVFFDITMEGKNKIFKISVRLD